MFQPEQQLQGSQLAMNASSMMLPSALSPIVSLNESLNDALSSPFAQDLSENGGRKMVDVGAKALFRFSLWGRGSAF